MLPNRRNDIWHSTNLFGIIAGYQSTSVHSGMKTKNHKYSVFGKDKALPYFYFSSAGIYPRRLPVQAHKEGFTAADVLSGGYYFCFTADCSRSSR